MPWADKKATEAMGMPGRIHRGFFNFASQFFREFEDQVRSRAVHARFDGSSGSLVNSLSYSLLQRKSNHTQVDLNGIKRITFTGHSLGGAIAQVSAAFMTKNHNHLKINCVTFGSPQVHGMMILQPPTD